MKNSKEFWDKSARRYAKSPVRDEATYQKKLAITRSYFQPDWSVLEFAVQKARDDNVENAVKAPTHPQ
ncbi:MAG TPA: hypothetical protein VFN01_09955 [Marinobacter sp.]|uniref:hypothetical protein n=1 Tax=Marinobacter sp. TaxID=50741 RepID=UPI002D80F850|nr:hypothetical protein [Marinobacter sp.]HET8801496.1 hypothetical protein [Marinobacter sp.]